MARRVTTTCSFCGKPQGPGRKLIAGPDRISICNECVHLCNTLIAAEPSAAAGVDHRAALKVPFPHEIKAFLDQYVIGHSYTKKVLSVAVHNHYKRLLQETHFQKDDPLFDVEIEKSNIVMLGPTGSGKTLLARTLARMLDVPFTIVDATTLTEAGYVGEDVENILLSLLQASEMDTSRAEMGIIYVDEIDKIGRKTENVSITRDVSGEGVQQGLLKILEGTIARVPPGGGRKHPQQDYIKIDTSHILFICGGAFVGLDGIVRRRVGKRAMGFYDRAEDVTLIAEGEGLHIEPEDLIRYGLIPELVGRLPIVASLSELTEEDLMHILVEPKNCMVKQYQKLLAMENIDLSFTDTALRGLARMAVKSGTGARGLRAILEKLMLDVMFEAPRVAEHGSIRITKSMVDQQRVQSDAILNKLKKIA